MLFRPLRIIVGVVLEESFLLGWGEAEALLDAGTSFQVRAGGESSGHPLNRHHLALARQESLVGRQLHESRSNAGSVEQLEHLRIRLIGDRRLSLHHIHPDAIVGGNLVLVEQQNESGIVRQVENLLGFALVEQLSELVIAN